MCPTCNQPTDPGAVFCGNCGQQLIEASPATHTTAYELPSYAVGTAAMHTGEIRATMSVIVGAVGVVGAIMPLVGLALGITGIVLGTLTRRLHKKVSTIGIIVSVIAVLISLATWTYIIVTQADAKQANDPVKRGVANAAAPANGVTTACYTASFSGQLNVSTTDNSCDMQAYDGSTLDTSSSAYKIYGYQQPSLNKANFMGFAKEALEKDVANNLPEYTIGAESVGQFAGRPAYFVNAVNKQSGVAYIEAAVLRSDSASNNVFVFVHATLGTKTNLDTIEADWQWK